MISSIVCTIVCLCVFHPFHSVIYTRSPKIKLALKQTLESFLLILWKPFFCKNYILLCKCSMAVQHSLFTPWQQLPSFNATAKKALYWRTIRALVCRLLNALKQMQQCLYYNDRLLYVCLMASKVNESEKVSFFYVYEKINGHFSCSLLIWLLWTGCCLCYNTECQQKCTCIPVFRRSLD